MPKKHGAIKKSKNKPILRLKQFITNQYYLLIFASLILYIAVLTVYCITLPNTNTGFADSDEFILAAKVHGVVHPSGYPLYTIFTTVITSLPFPLTFAGKANLLSSLLHAGVVVNIFLISFFLLKKFSVSLMQRLFSASFTSIFLATFLAFWFNGLFAEVFSLNNFFISLILLLFVILKNNAHVPLRSSEKQTRLLFLSIFFISGIGLSNQQSLLLFVPLFVFLLFWIDRIFYTNWKLLGGGILLFCFGFLLPYIYLPIAAHTMSVVNFENPQTVSGVIRSITRRSYGEVYGAAYIGGSEISLNQRLFGLQFFWIFLTQSITWPILLLSFTGIGYIIFKRNFSLLCIFGLGIIGGGLFFAFYSPPAVSLYFLHELGITQRFYLASLLFIALLSLFGTQALFALISAYEKNFTFLGYIVLVCITAYQYSFSYHEVRITNFSLGKQFAQALLTSLDKNSLLICYKEPVCFTTLYIQTEEHLRPDVLIIPADMNQQRIEQLNLIHPGLIETNVQERTAQDSVPIVKDLIKTNLLKRPIFVAGIEHTPNHLITYGLYNNPYYLIPQGCSMKLSTTFSYRKKTTNCDDVEKTALAKSTTENMPIAGMFINYLSYQRFFNYQVYTMHGCISQATKEYSAAMKLNPILAAVHLQAPVIGKINECNLQI